MISELIYFNKDIDFLLSRWKVFLIHDFSDTEEAPKSRWDCKGESWSYNNFEKRALDNIIFIVFSYSLTPHLKTKKYIKLHQE